jgi:heme/copper-type cytochrome/quinol oxidase subunit 3
MMPAELDLDRERAGLPLDDQRGTLAMWLLIATEAALFGVLFFAYFELDGGHLRWPGEPLPKLSSALTMLAVLLGSSVVLHLGERGLRSGQLLLGRIAPLLASALGLLFLTLQAREYAERLKELTPTSDAYGSMFYTITSIHGLHLVVGILMLLYVTVLPRLEHASHSPHRALHNATLYWHFVDSVWIVIVALLYVAPRLAA